MSNKNPLVLLAGRTNVGKSALFNRIVGSKRSVVFDRDGVTRDWIEEIVSWDKKTFRLMDIGGLEGGSEIADMVRAMFIEKVSQAAVIVMVCDVTTGVVNNDIVVAKLLQQCKKPVILVVNKADDAQKDLEAFEFYSLGLGEPITISALHARGVGDLLSHVSTLLPDERDDVQMAEENYMCKVSIIGKPNAGKSSLLNCLLQQTRSIVFDEPGTTRETIIEKFFIKDVPFQLADTAGVRRQRSVEDELETIMVKSSMEAIRRSDLVILMIDASLGQLCAQDLKLLAYAVEQHKSLVMVLNKTDLLTDDYVEQQLESDLQKYEFLARKFPVVRISCKSKKNIGKLQQTILDVWQRSQQKFDSEKIAEILVEQMLRHPLHKSGHVLKVWRVKAIPSRVPTFHIKVNIPKMFEESHVNYMENILRNNIDLFGCPIRIICH